MPFLSSWFECVRANNIEGMIKLRKHNIDANVDEKEEGTELTALAIAAQTNNDQIIHFLLAMGASPNLQCFFPDVKEEMTIFEYACLHSKLSLLVIPELYEYSNVSDDTRRSIADKLRANTEKREIFNFLNEPERFALEKSPDSYEKLWSTATSITKSAHLLLKDYFAPLKLSFLHLPKLQRLLTLHGNRHKGQLHKAEIYASQFLNLYNDVLSDNASEIQNEIKSLRGLSHLLSEINQYTQREFQKNTLNLHGSFARRIRFLNQRFNDFIKAILTADIDAQATSTTSMFFSAQKEESKASPKTTFKNFSSIKVDIEKTLQIINQTELMADETLSLHTLSEHHHLNAF